MVQFISCVQLCHLEGRETMVFSAFHSSLRILLDISRRISLEFLFCMPSFQDSSVSNLFFVVS